MATDFAFPFCRIYFNLQDYIKKVENFYLNGGREKVEEYRIEIEKRFGLEIRHLNWHDEMGLDSIALSLNIGFDLDRGRYVLHNLYDSKSSGGQAMFEITKKYVELLEEIN
jgi:hypothetical protein